MTTDGQTRRLRQRKPRVENKPFLAFVRRQACCACGFPKSQAAHIRMSNAAHGALNPGVGAKPDDAKCVPLCEWCHLTAPHAQHRIGERRFWAEVGIDPFVIAKNLYAQFERERATGVKPSKPYVLFGPKRKARRTSVSRPKVSRPKRKWPTRKIASRRK